MLSTALPLSSAFQSTFLNAEQLQYDLARMDSADSNTVWEALKAPGNAIHKHEQPLTSITASLQEISARHEELHLLLKPPAHPPNWLQGENLVSPTLQPSSYPSERFPVAYIINHLTRRARDEVTAGWERQSTICSSN